jgi:hypothetical protein
MTGKQILDRYGNLGPGDRGDPLAATADPMGLVDTVLGIAEDLDGVDPEVHDPIV